MDETEPDQHLDLLAALRLDKQVLAAFVGSGGKTTAIFRIARGLNGPVVVTTSTHLGVWQSALADRQITVTRPEDIEGSAGQIEGVTLITGPQTDDNRLRGLDFSTLHALKELALRSGFHVLVEADGSRMRPLKAPGPNEPVIPEWAQIVIVVAGLSGLGKPLTEENIHRPKLFSELSGLEMGALVTEEGVARVLVEPAGGRKGIPAGARRILFLNDVDFPAKKESGMRIANMVRREYNSVIVGNAKSGFISSVLEPTAGIVLAAGQSSRFGSPKMLLEWHGKPLIWHAAQTAIDAGLRPVIVVTGAVKRLVQNALVESPVTLVDNPNWEEGQGTSVRVGINALPSSVSSAVFLLADQPFASVALVQALVLRHQQTLAPIIAPRVGEKRANPVLFDRVTFPALSKLAGEQGGRALFDQFPILYLDWDDPKLLIDIDTPEDFQRLKDVE